MTLWPAMNYTTCVKLTVWHKLKYMLYENEVQHQCLDASYNFNEFTSKTKQLYFQSLTKFN